MLIIKIFFNKILKCNKVINYIYSKVCFMQVTHCTPKAAESPQIVPSTQSNNLVPSPIVPQQQFVSANSDLKNRLSLINPGNTEPSPYPNIICKSIGHLLEIFETKNPQDISLLFPHDSVSTFFKRLLPFICESSLNNTEQYLLCLDLLYQRVQVFFYKTTEPNTLFDVLSDHGNKWIERLQSVIKQDTFSLAFSIDEKTRVDEALRELGSANIHDLEQHLTLELDIMDKLDKKRKAGLENYPKYLELLNVKFRNALCLRIKNETFYFYPIDQGCWTTVKPADALKKIKLAELPVAHPLKSRLEKMGNTHFICATKYTLKVAKYFISLKKKTENLSLQQACESIISAHQLREILNPDTMDKGFIRWLERKFRKFQGERAAAKIVPFIVDLLDIYQNLTIPFLCSDGSIPKFFTSIFQARLNRSIATWNQHRETQEKFLDYIRANQQEALVQKDATALPQPAPALSEKPKKRAEKTVSKTHRNQDSTAHSLPSLPEPKPKKCLQTQPAEKPVPKTEIKKQSHLKQLVNTIQNVAGMVKDKKSIITPCLTETLQQQLSRSTCNIPTSYVKRVEMLPGKEPKFQKLFRVSKWEEQTVKFLDPFSDELEQELIQYIFHIPHPLVDRFIHLGIKGTREGSDCITIPAEITINGIVFKGSIGYTFTADGICFHRHFTKNIIEQQKKEAVSYVDFPKVGHAYAKPLPSVYVAQYKCSITQDEAGNVMLQHKQIAYYAEKKENTLPLSSFVIHIYEGDIIVSGRTFLSNSSAVR